MKVRDLFNFEKKSKIKAGEGLKQGEFPFYTSSQTLSKKINTWQHSKPCLIFGTGGLPSIHFEENKFSTSTDCIVLSKKTDIEINEKYPFYFLLSNIHIIERGFKGAGLKHISKKYIQEIDIPITTLERQNEIVALLDRVKLLINKREDTINKLDAFLSSQFLKMFGKTNPNFNVWDEIQIQDLALDKKGSMRSGPFGSNLKHSEFVDDGPVAVLGIDNAVDNKFKWKERRYITEEKYEKLKRYTVYPRDVIITIMGTIGRSAVIPDNIEKAINTKHLACISLDPEKCNPYYLAYSIHSNPFLHYQMKARDRGAIMSGLNLTIIKELKLKNAPIKFQNEFEKIYHKVESQKDKLLSSKQNLEDLFNSIAQRAFSGQVNIDEEVALESLLDEIDLDVDIDKKDISNIATAYLRELVEKINERDFEDLIQYRKAKKVAFQLLESGDLSQRYNENDKSVELIISQ